MKIPHTLLLTQALFILLFSGCHKDKNNNNNSSTPETGAVLLHIHTDLDTNEVEYGQVYMLSSGRKITTSFAQMYLSNFELEKTDGSWVSAPDSVVLKTLEQEVYYLNTSFPVGTYKAIRFKTGIASGSINKHASADMQYSGNAADGYAFIRFDGKIDTTKAANGSPYIMQPFSYKLGTNAAILQVTLPDRSQPWTLTSNGAITVHIIANYAALFKGIDLSQPANLTVTTPQQMTREPALSLIKNIPSMFSYEE